MAAADDGPWLARLLAGEPNSIEPKPTRGGLLWQLGRLVTVAITSNEVRSSSDLGKLIMFNHDLADSPALAGMVGPDLWRGGLLRAETVWAWRRIWRDINETHLKPAGVLPVQDLVDLFADSLSDVPLSAFLAELPPVDDGHERALDAERNLDHLSDVERWIAIVLLGSKRGQHLNHNERIGFAGSNELHGTQWEELTPGWTEQLLGRHPTSSLRDLGRDLALILINRSQRVALRKANYNPAKETFSFPARIHVRDGVAILRVRRDRARASNTAASVLVDRATSWVVRNGLGRRTYARTERRLPSPRPPIRSHPACLVIFAEAGRGDRRCGKRFSSPSTSTSASSKTGSSARFVRRAPRSPLSRMPRCSTRTPARCEPPAAATRSASLTMELRSTKLTVLAGTQRALIGVGSGNVTIGGWHANREVLTVITASRDEGTPRIVTDVIAFLREVVRTITIGPLARDGIERTADTLEALVGASQLIETGHQLVHSLSTPIIEQLPGGGATALELAAPFHDEHGRALDVLVKRYQPEAITVLAQPGQAVMTPTALEASAGTIPLRFVQPDSDSATSRYRHGKVLTAITEGAGEWSLTGSPNLTAAALLRSASGAPVGNCELGIVTFNGGRLLLQRCPSPTWPRSTTPFRPSRRVRPNPDQSPLASQRRAAPTRGFWSCFRAPPRWTR